MEEAVGIAGVSTWKIFLGVVTPLVPTRNVVSVETVVVKVIGPGAVVVVSKAGTVVVALWCFL